MPLNKEEKLTARTNNDQVSGEKIKGDRDSCLSSIDTDVIDTENDVELKMNVDKDSNVK